MKRMMVLLLMLALLSGCTASHGGAEDGGTEAGGDLSGIQIVTIGSKTHYVAQTHYSGEYDVAKINIDFDDYDDRNWDEFRTSKIMTLEQYTEFCRTWDIPQAYTEEGSYAVHADSEQFYDIYEELYGLDICHQNATLYITQHHGYTECRYSTSVVLTVPVPSEVKNVEIVMCVPPEAADNLGEEDYQELMPEKPILYLYPIEDTALTVTLGHPENITCSYPAYDDGWQILAHPDGTMEDLSTGRSLYALYWEGKNYPFHGEQDGFVVPGEESAAFLEEKLAILGLSEREAEEFIIYWLPRLEASPYNYIRFAPQEELDEYMPLSFTVQPDCIIRVLMQYAPLDTPIPVQPQHLETPMRSGFVAVEWGGAEILCRQ